MHDGAGAWIKSAVALAVMAGEDIDGAEEFFDYCKKFLSEGKEATRLKRWDD